MKIADRQECNVIHEAVQFNHVKIVDCLLQVGESIAVEATLPLLDLGGGQVTYARCSLLHFAVASKTDSDTRDMIDADQERPGCGDEISGRLDAHVARIPTSDGTRRSRTSAANMAE